MEKNCSNEYKYFENLSRYYDKGLQRFYMSKDQIKAKLDSWKHQKLSIGVIGESGSGKTTLINSIRGIFPNDPGAAKTDVTECTTYPQKYPFPKNENIVVWDLPGISPSFPLESYLEKITFKKEQVAEKQLPNEYDYFLLCSANRFSESDFRLELKLIEKKKNFLFVHLKFDLDIDGEESRTGQSIRDLDELKLMEKIRTDIRLKSNKNLVGYKRPEIFIISAKMKKKNNIIEVDNRDKYEFNKLIEHLTNSFNEEKQNAFIMSVMPSGKESIKSKCKVLRKQIKYATILSGLGGAIPIPFLSFGIDLSVLTEQVVTYIYQLNISPKEIEKTCKSFGVCYNDLVPILEKNRLFSSFLKFLVPFTAIIWSDFAAAVKILMVPLGEFVTKYFSSYLASNTAEEISKIVFPGIGGLLGCVISASSTYYILKTIMDSFEKGLIDTFDYCIKNSKIEEH